MAAMPGVGPLRQWRATQDFPNREVKNYQQFGRSSWPQTGDSFRSGVASERHGGALSSSSRALTEARLKGAAAVTGQAGGHAGGTGLGHQLI